MLDDRVLINLAIVKSNWDQNHRSILDNFMPIVGTAMSLLEEEEISEADLKIKIEEFSGFKIPSGAISVLIRRSTKKQYGFATKKEGLFIKNKALLDSLGFKERRMAAKERIANLKAQFSNFIDTHFENDDGQAQDGDIFIDVLSAIAPRLLRSIEMDGHDILEELEPTTYSYYVGAFIIYCKEAKPEAFNSIMEVAKGAILAELLYYTDESFVEKRMSDIKIFLDTQVILRILGLAETYEIESCREMLKLIQDLGGKLRIFEQTRDELTGIFTAASASARNGWNNLIRPGDAFDSLARMGETSSDIELRISQIERDLAKWNIKIEPSSPAVSNHEINFDWVRLSEKIHHYIPNQNDKSRKHDMDCISSIHQLRKGKPQKHFESCKAIFVTTNVDLARATVRFFNEEYGVSDAPIVITNNVFTMLMWLKSVNKRPDLPNEIIIQNAIASTMPNQVVWEKYIEEGRRLLERKKITIEDFNLLSRSLEARSALMDITHGDLDAVTGGTVLDVLRKSKSKIAFEYTEPYRKRDELRENFYRKLHKYGAWCFVFMLSLLWGGSLYILFSLANPKDALIPELSIKFGMSALVILITIISIVCGFSLRNLIFDKSYHLMDSIIGHLKKRIG